MIAEWTCKTSNTFSRKISWISALFDPNIWSIVKCLISIKYYGVKNRSSRFFLNFGYFELTRVSDYARILYSGKAESNHISKHEKEPK